MYVGVSGCYDMLYCMNVKVSLTRLRAPLLGSPLVHTQWAEG